MGILGRPARIAAVTSRRLDGNGRTSTRRGRSTPITRVWHRRTAAPRVATGLYGRGARPDAIGATSKADVPEAADVCLWLFPFREIHGGL